LFALGLFFVYPINTLLFIFKKGLEMARTHGNKEFSELLREIERIGFRVEITKSGVYKLYPPKDIGGRIYITHGTPKAIKPIKSEFKKIYGINLGKI
jgi:hypothetical protein